jgi:hypothetical protein
MPLSQSPPSAPYIRRLLLPLEKNILLQQIITTNLEDVINNSRKICIFEIVMQQNGGYGICICNNFSGRCYNCAKSFAAFRKNVAKHKSGYPTF